MSSRSVIIIATALLSMPWSFVCSGQEAYGTYGFFPQGSSRVLSMGGAFTALSDDASAMSYNPAGLAQARWSVDISSDTNRIINKEADFTGSNTPDGLPYTASSTNIASRWKRLGVAAGITEQYNLDFDFGGVSTQHHIIKVQSYDFSLAWSFHKRFSLGVTASQETALVAFEDNISGTRTEDEQNSLFYRIGILAQLNPKISVGLSYHQERFYDIDEKLDTVASNSWFHDVYIPAKTSLGFKVKLSQRMTWVFDMDKYGSRPKTLFVGTTSSFYEAKDQTVLRGGFEYQVISDKDVEFMWRGGGYNEPARLSNQQPRPHFTMGVSMRWGFITFSAAYDQATDFSTTSQSAGINFNALSQSI